MRAVVVWGLALAAAAGRAWAQQSGAAMDDELRWGTYRPNLYFGTRPQAGESLLSGLMWFGLDRERQGWRSIRHACELGDNLSEYGYVRHNGRDFGEQEIRDADHGVEIRSEFVKVPGARGGSWAVRFTGRTLGDSAEGVSLIYYFGLEGNGTLAMGAAGDDAVRIRGRTPDLGRFAIRIVPGAHNQSPPLPAELRRVAGVPRAQRIAGLALTVPSGTVWRAKDAVQERLMERAQAAGRDLLQRTGGRGPLAGRVLFGLESEGVGRRGSNLVVAQMVVHGEFAFDVVYEGPGAPLAAGDIGALAARRRGEFDARFEATFGLRRKGFGEADVALAQRALSSLVGGIGYFYGSGLVADGPAPEYGDDAGGAPRAAAGPSAPYALLATTPSRPFFPRGFLWDEGFHQLLLARWDAGLSVEIMRSWLRTMDAHGWIAREQILGDEARSKVPAEFQVQYPNLANPPTLLLAAKALAERAVPDRLAALEDQLAQVYGDDAGGRAPGAEHVAELRQLSSRLAGFFRRTQAGARGRGYRWRGRSMDHTLASGLDDYPRARPPSSGELHVDLFAWVTYMLLVDTELAAYAGDDGGGARGLNETRAAEARLEEHLRLLDELHWNAAENMYCDVTMRARADYDELDDEPGDAEEPVFVCHRGYVSLLPMALGLVPADSPKLGHILDMIEDPDALWSEYGLRSLARSDAFYGKGENYWRGPVWININYLVLASLHTNYAAADGPHRAQAARIYRALRENVIANVLGQYRKTGFFWENYSAEDGRGQGTHPFTGWTSLIVLIMAEQYH
ncbi:Processing alpha glucosidase I [Coemansia javaensis]|uniref:Mannosyl-oligosaccharide glucosidase n=1 Tax=Coemansia javaensis TaxID=2761396 RepID=A0A9W8H4U5_9FUNG|nr:Processing alpha glucosidase I [Coemansia javaensis]